MIEDLALAMRARIAALQGPPTDALERAIYYRCLAGWTDWARWLYHRPLPVPDWRQA